VGGGKGVWDCVNLIERSHVYVPKKKHDFFKNILGEMRGCVNLIKRNRVY
jgi:hypothetical protein